MNVTAARACLRELIGQTGMVLELRGIAIPVALKRRDPREPRRRDKERAEDRVIEIVLRHWRKQRARLRKYLEEQYPGRKDLGDPLGDPDPADVAEVMLVFSDAARAGVDIFSRAVGERMDVTSPRSRAAVWASRHAGDLFDKIDGTTRDAVREAVSAFIQTEGMTLANVVDLLPLDESRATSIAVTEITRAFAQGELIAGDEMRAEYPGVAVRKTWFTNADDRVCSICGPMDGQDVDLDGVFYGGDGEKYTEPPTHPNCRCWIDVTTDILA